MEERGKVCQSRVRSKAVSLSREEGALSWVRVGDPEGTSHTERLTVAGVGVGCPRENVSL